MNFLFIRAKKSIFDLPWALLEMGHNVSIIEEYEYDPLIDQPDAYLAIENKLKDGNFDFLISYIFFPMASDICQKLNVKYISWTYDSPLVSFFSASIYNSCNYTFVFDSSECKHLWDQNIPHLYYLPMATNLSRTGALNISAEDEQNYSCDISFIGNLYEENSYNTFISFLPEELGLEVKTYLMKNLCNWHETKIWPQTSASLSDFLEKNLKANSWNKFDIPNPLYYGLLLYTRKLAEMDRVTVLNTLAQDHNVDLYTHSNTKHLINVTTHQGVDYYTDMNKIFYLSKINLNITLPSIETGLPQRIFDIMGCGGFVLTNYQKDIEGLFEIGKEIEVFHDLPELLEKVDYYLSHEKERLTIAMNGYMKVRDHHTYQHRINEMLHVIEEENS